MTNTEIAYVAGLIDGEGCIFITEKRPTKGAVNPSFHLGISIVNTSLPMLQYVRRVFGGHLSRNGQPRRLRSGNISKPCWQWGARSLKAASILIHLLPYLVVKREQAVIGLAFAENVATASRPSRGQGRGRMPLRAEDLELRRGMAEQLKVLKRA